MIRFRSAILFCVLLASCLFPWSVRADDLDQTDPAFLQAQALAKNLTPEEKVGQLFLVTFKGQDVSSTSQIYNLISQYHVGGVVLLASNDNFGSADRTPQAVHQLIGQLQSIEGDTSISFQTDPVTGSPFHPSYVPLLVGISQEGDGYPTDQIFNGVTTLPSSMAIGATWKPSNATALGTILGSELQNLGFNLYLGPSLDVLDTTHVEGNNDLGTRSFGGNPYWVSQMGSAFITGIHQGSDNRIAVISKYFPGSGDADRLPDDEVSTVRRTLDQLKQVELAPFFAVTGDAASADATTDGLLVTHIRYQGFQGNISPAIKPVSSDPGALSTLMALPELASWRQKEGVLVSDDLGSRALRLYYDPSGKSFNARTAAVNAFLAGNDILYGDNFVSNGDPDSYTTMKNTLEFFAGKYRTDPVFQQQVDTSLIRILTMKFHLYPSFKLVNVVTSDSSLSLIGLDKSRQTVSDIARQAVTLISPSAAELDNVIPKAPDVKERIVFLTDVQTGTQCNQCQDQTPLDVDSLQNSVLKFYGPAQSGQASPDHLVSYSFADLANFLNKVKAPQNIESDIQNANWVVISILNPNPDKPETLALKDLMAARPDLLANKKVIVFAFGAPYNLDATDISKITAYFALYSKTPQFIDVAAHVLYREIVPAGALPISVGGVGYDIGAALSPDPAQVIPLALDIPQNPKPTGTATSLPTTVPTYKVGGEPVALIAGPIYDHNHNLVPDNTVVHFIFQTGGETGPIQSVDALTQAGIARASYRYDRPGLLVIKVTSDPAANSQVLSLNVTDTGAVSTIVVVVTNQPPTITPTPTATATPTQTITPTLTLTPVPPRTGRPLFGEWVLSILVIMASAVLAYGLGFLWWGTIRWGMRWSLCAISGGLLAYLYLAAGLPGSASWVRGAGTGGILGATFGGVIFGWVVAIFWRYSPVMFKFIRVKAR